MNQPVGGDIDKELRAAGKGVSKVTIGLAVAVLVALAFGGGALVHKALASPATAAPAAGQGRGGGYGGPGGGGFPGGGYGGQGVPGQGGQGVPGQGRGGTVGTVDHVEGSTVYVKTQDGKLVKVSTSDSTTVDLVTKGALTDLAAGDPVVVQGQQAEDGSVTARALTRRQAAG